MAVAWTQGVGSVKGGVKWLRLRFCGPDLVLLLVLAALQYPLWLGTGSWWNVATLHRKVVERQALLSRLKARNDRLAAEVAGLQGGDGAVAGLARRHLGMIRKGEIFVWVIHAHRVTATNTSSSTS